MGGQRITETELHLRVTAVYTMLVKGFSFWGIVDACEAEYKWGVKPNTIRKYVRRADDILAKEATARHDVELGKAISRYARQYRNADARGDHRGAAMIQGKIDDLLGLQAPKRNEHSGPGGGPIAVEGALSALEEEIVAAVIATVSGGDSG